MTQILPDQSYGNFTRQVEPKVVDALEGVQVAAVAMSRPYHGHTVAVTADGDVWFWGEGRGLGRPEYPASGVLRCDPVSGQMHYSEPAPRLLAYSSR